MSAWPSAEPESPASPPFLIPVGDLLPHAGNVVLLDALLEVGPSHAMAELTVRDDGLFSQPDGSVPAWVGLEYMAQTVAAFSGYWRRQRGLGVDLGFLLGTRHFTCNASSFPCGTRLRVRADKVMDGVNDMSVFNCLVQGGSLHAECTLNVYLPKDSRAFLAGRST